MANNTISGEREREEVQKLNAKADHLSNFGNLTSLASTGVYFIEKAILDKIPRWLNNLSLATVGLGIASVCASFYYRIKAGEKSSAILNKTSQTTETPAWGAEQNENTSAKWVKQEELHRQPSSMER